MNPEKAKPERYVYHVTYECCRTSISKKNKSLRKLAKPQ